MKEKLNEKIEVEQIIAKATMDKLGVSLQSPVCKKLMY